LGVCSKQSCADTLTDDRCCRRTRVPARRRNRPWESIHGVSPLAPSETISESLTKSDLQRKVLTHENGIPVICGYGMSTILGPSANSTALFACPIRYSAPEYFSDETGTSSVRTKAGDIYAFAMVTLEVADSTSTFFSLILALDSIGTGTISSSTDGTHRFQAHSSGWSAHSYTSRSTGNHQAHLELLDFAVGSDTVVTA
jgi:hypothetical protein